MEENCLIQGYEGSFHEEAMRAYFPERPLKAIPCDSFDILAKGLKNNKAELAIMAIENSIAGSILQNYRILREFDLQIVGEYYLRIQHQLMALEGQKVGDIKEAISHPMAINQCLDFLDLYPSIQRTEFSDTALAARHIAENKCQGKAAIASRLAAKIYGLEVIASDIETDEKNYTRFFIVQNRRQQHAIDFDKSSIYLRVSHHKGSLLKALEILAKNNINLSKLQSFPVIGHLQEYYFHMDLEFGTVADYRIALEELKNKCKACDVLGEYKRAALDILVQNKKEVV